MPEASGSRVVDESDYSTFENKTGLAEDMKFLASMPELCDVTFLVGDTREPVCAVKAVLAARSRLVSTFFFPFSFLYPFFPLSFIFYLLLKKKKKMIRSFDLLIIRETLKTKRKGKGINFVFSFFFRFLFFFLFF